MNMFKPTAATSPEEYIAQIEEPRRSEVQKLYEFINQTLPSEQPYMSTSFISWGKYHYKSKSGREGEWMTIALASQKNYISVYVCAIKDGNYLAEMNKDKLGKVSVGKSCIRFKKLGDVNLETLKSVIQEAIKYPMNSM